MINMINIKGLKNKNYEFKETFYKEDLVNLEKDMEKLMDDAAIEFSETLDSYESSFKKIENLDFLGITDKGLYFVELISNDLTIEQIEKEINKIYKNLPGYKLKLMREKKKQNYKAYKDELDFKINKIEKYLLMEKIKNKLPEKNNNEKRSKI